MTMAINILEKDVYYNEFRCLAIIYMGMQIHW